MYGGCDILRWAGLVLLQDGKRNIIVFSIMDSRQTTMYKHTKICARKKKRVNRLRGGLGNLMGELHA
jgi:hypothetical protein